MVASSLLNSIWCIFTHVYCCVLFVYASAHTFARRWCVSRARATRETGGPCAPQVCACMRKVRSYMCVCVCRARKVMVKSLSVRRPNLPPPRLDTTHVWMIIICLIRARLLSFCAKNCIAFSETLGKSNITSNSALGKQWEGNINIIWYWFYDAHHILLGVGKIH